jgi:hypothetical protein
LPENPDKQDPVLQRDLLVHFLLLLYSSFVISS